MLYLHGVGHFHPENVIDNTFLEALDIGSSEQWVLERVGIHSRRTVLDLDYIRTTKNEDPRGAFEASVYTNAQTGAKAARMAIERAGISPADIGLVISGTCVPDNAIPAEAASIASGLGINAICFDLNSACTSFGMQIHFLEAMRPEALPPYVLLVNPENMTKSVDYRDRSVAVLFGDGSSAAVVSTKVPAPMMFSSCFCQSKPAAWDKVIIPRMGHFHQDGHAVQAFAIRKTTDSVRMLKKQFPITNGHFKFIGHQANLGMLQTVCERAEIPEINHWHNVESYGNTGCAGAPIVLSQHWHELVPGDHVAIALVGSGLTWTHMMLGVKEYKNEI
ncbi:MAG: ketoacyl-ACP synthase III [Syntrophales bacterium]|jgi:3-oxoacyl-[acyl-carrier-protein] synthase-3|nr:ketoacyl-ACP synthase III [Syntrophales bacterium]